ncbi:MAG: hypothetical protein AB1473_23860 [Thermodesulfobacteriota bacterium]
MSISALADIIVKDMTREPKLKALGLTLAEPTPTQPEEVKNALSQLVKFIPTEVMTVYIPIATGLPLLQPKVPKYSLAEPIFWVFVGLTPIIVVVATASALAKRVSDPAAGRRLLIAPRQWPWWRMVAGMFSFVAWALAITGGPYLTGDVGHFIAGLIVLGVSAFILLIDPLFKKPSD